MYINIAAIVHSTIYYTSFAVSSCFTSKATPTKKKEANAQMMINFLSHLTGSFVFAHRITIVIVIFYFLFEIIN